LKHETQAIKNPPAIFQTVSLERLSEKGLLGSDSLL
jgi:hypothetical protein